MKGSHTAKFAYVDGRFLNPQGNVWISPRVGGMFMNKTIVGLYYLHDFVWKAIEEAPK